MAHVSFTNAVPVRSLMEPVYTPHDRFFKAIFSRPELAGDLLRQILPANSLAQFDLATIHPEKDSFIDADLQLQYADLLYSVNLADQRPAFIYVLFEHKSYVQSLMAYDVLRYMVRIWEAGQKQKPPAPLAPILPIVVYHGLAPWREPLNMGGLFPGPAAMRPHWPTCTYQLVDLSQVPEPAAAGMLHLEAALWALRNSHREDVVAHLAELLRLLAELTRTYGAVQYSITILHYVSSVHKDVDAATIRQALRDASVDAGEKLMATWLDERYEANRQRNRQRKSARGSAADCDEFPPASFWSTRRNPHGAGQLSGTRTTRSADHCAFRGQRTCRHHAIAQPLARHARLWQSTSRQSTIPSEHHPVRVVSAGPKPKRCVARCQCWWPNAQPMHRASHLAPHKGTSPASATPFGTDGVNLAHAGDGFGFGKANHLLTCVALIVTSPRPAVRQSTIPSGW
ncbi:MAG: Rpn family recombination-promoting nuclease/putative transposase [Anaerolineales bacterium]|nr:Rpn family recombination-promoting nuclease/putative transposase [Anaerolineales bacterium]